MGLDHGLIMKNNAIQEDLFVWRKENHIHKWFVTNCQEGIDDCGEYVIPFSKIEELYNTAEMILQELKKEKLISKEVYNGETYIEKEWKVLLRSEQLPENVSAAINLMPTQSGFFFGSTDYDSYYISSLVEIVKILKPYLDKKDENIEFLYWSSW